MLIDLRFQDMSSISKLLQWLIAIEKSKSYFLIDMLIYLMLTFLVSIIKFVKTFFRNKMDNEFVENCMIIFFERELSNSID